MARLERRSALRQDQGRSHLDTLTFVFGDEAREVDFCRFCGGTEKISLVSPDFFRGTATRREGEAGSRARVRWAQGLSPACHARENRGVRKRGMTEGIKACNREGKRRFPKPQGLKGVVFWPDD